MAADGAAVEEEIVDPVADTEVAGANRAMATADTGEVGVAAKAAAAASGNTVADKVMEAVTVEVAKVVALGITTANTVRIRIGAVT